MGEMAPSDDKYAAVVFVWSKPLDLFAKRKWPEGYTFLPAPLTQRLEEYYLPAQLESSDYPGLIPEGQRIRTIAVASLLAIYDWDQTHITIGRLPFRSLLQAADGAGISSQVGRNQSCGCRARVEAFPGDAGQARRGWFGSGQEQEGDG